ncbi:MAG TPA: chloride channel protein, partial [Stellaceae bacterium]|nr:chloride channel protein [Stellaceae bacterium]
SACVALLAVEGPALILTEEQELHHRRGFASNLKTRVRLFARHNIRNSDVGMAVVAAAIGAVIAFGVALTSLAVAEFHHLLFGVRLEQRLSGIVEIARWRLLLVPCLGGIVYGLVAYALWRWKPRDIVDAIEANALHGGHMSLSDSLRLTGLTVLSAGVGASVGLEAAYTQLGAGIASRIGRQLHLRRGDLRTYVGCGAAAAIAAAFNAPLAGAFYAFELIIGSYTLTTLVPVVVAAIFATLVTRTLFGEQPIFVAYAHVDSFAANYLILAVVGLVAGLLAIGAMIGVTFVEQWSKRAALPTWARPALGGLILGNIAWFFPQVLGSGHGGIESTIASGPDTYALPLLLLLIFAKMIGSAVSIGSGFRGGMFSSSLFLGALYGSAVALILHQLMPGLAFNATIYILAGMGAVAAGVVGAPVTMILLVLESTSDFSATLGVTVSVIISILVVRHGFGYSFATWRFHLRGVALHSPHDIGWLHDLQVANLMRRDFTVVPVDLPLQALCRQFPIDSAMRIFVVDEKGAYQGVVDLIEAYAMANRDPETIQIARDVAHGAEHFLTPGQPVRETLDRFIASAAETLAVVDNPRERHVQGYLSEAFALRRYYRQLEARHREELGDDELFNLQHAASDD